MAYKSKDLIYILSTRPGYIPPLRQYGPIVNPLKVSVAVAEKCVMIGVPVAQYDPNSGKVINLTRDNIYDDKKFEKKEEKPAEKTEQQAPKSNKNVYQEQPSVTVTPVQDSEIDAGVTQTKKK